MPVTRLAIFDCDGTLVDSQAPICAAMEECFVRARLDPPARNATRRVVGLSLVEAMRALVPDAEARFHHALAEDYKSIFARLRGEGLVEEPLFEGIVELIEALDSDGWLLGVATGKSDRGLSHCLRSHGILDRFVTLQTADTHPSKPHPAMLEAAIAETGAEAGASMMIGDTSYDMAMARAAGVSAVGIVWGYHDAQELLDAGAHYVAESPASIMTFSKSFA
jgi:phosphoglycolate phosphatase